MDLVELPRLKLAFTSREDHAGNINLYSIDHADLYITNKRPHMIGKILEGIPHSLVMSNSQHELSVLVAVLSPVRPIVESQPFTTELVLDRQDDEWYNGLSQKYFIYPIHVSLSFLMTKGVDTVLYLILLRFLNRQYDHVFRLAGGDWNLRWNRFLFRKIY